MSPIIYKLHKEGEDVEVICSNMLFDLDRDYRIDYLKSEGVAINYYYSVLGYSSILDICVRRLLSLHPYFLKKIPKRFWSWFYHNNTISLVKFKKYIRLKKIKTVTYDEAQTVKNKANFYAAARFFSLPAILIPTSHRVMCKKVKKNKKGNYKDNCDYFLLPHGLNEDEREKKIILGSPKFGWEWVKKNKTLLYRRFAISGDTDDLRKITVLERPSIGFTSSSSIGIWLSKKSIEKGFEVSFIEKPRNVTPCFTDETDYFKRPAMSFINNSNLIICSITSLVIDAIAQRKKVIYLKFLDPLHSATFDESPELCIINSLSELESLDFDFVAKEKQKNIEKFVALHTQIDFGRCSLSILENYLNFYRDIENSFIRGV
jgi:hypothetical protein